MLQFELQLILPDKRGVGYFSLVLFGAVHYSNMLVVKKTPPKRGFLFCASSLFAAHLMFQKPITPAQ
ncbi:MAG: hypothetical protein ACI9H8_001839 [Lysobacterales bacterium]